MNINEGVKLHVIETKKFKDIGISIRFKNKLDKKSSPARSLLALLLCDRSLKYDTKQMMSSYLDTLYGASLSAQTIGYGHAQVMEVRMRTMDPQYAKDGEALIEDIFTFLHEIICCPLLTAEVFEEAKKMLLAKIERNEDDPAQYAIAEGLKYAGEGTPMALSVLGSKEDVQRLTLDDVKNAYEKMIHEDEITIILCGNLQQEDMKELIERHFDFEARTYDGKTYYQVENNLHDEYREAYRNISQSSIMMVWFTKTSIVDDEFYALRVANAMFGQYSTSLLFQEVREKNSLCYSIFSNLISYDSALGVTTGVEKTKIKKTIELIRKQFDCLVQGDFDDVLLDVSKQMIVNSLKASRDNMNSLIALAYQNELLKRNDSTYDIISKIEMLTRDDILKAISKCELKMTYVLTQGGE